MIFESSAGCHIETVDTGIERLHPSRKSIKVQIRLFLDITVVLINVDFEIFMDVLVAGVHVSTKVVKSSVNDHFDVERGLLDLSLGKLGSGDALVVVESLPVCTGFCEECVDLSLVVAVRDSGLTNLLSEGLHSNVHMGIGVVAVTVSAAVNIVHIVVMVAAILEMVSKNAGGIEAHSFFRLVLVDLDGSTKFVE